MGDIVTQFYPWRAGLNAKLASREIPLWNHHILMGAPFQAHPQTGVFFPLNWLFAVVAAPVAWASLFIIRSIIIGVVTGLYVRGLGLPTTSAAVSGLTFAFCGWVTAFQGRPHLDSAMWLPLLFLVVDYLRQRPSSRAIVFGAVAYTLPVLGGHPEVAAQVISAGVLYAMYRAIATPGRRLAYLGSLTAMGILSALLAAIQLVPTLEWLGHIPRTLEMRWGALSARQIVAFISRDIFHNPSLDGVFIPEGAAYAGAFLLAALPFAALWHKRTDVIFFAILAATCIQIAYGWPPAYWLSQHVPVLAGLPNWRFLVVADFSVAVLAGVAVTALHDRCRQTATSDKVKAAAAIVLTAAVAGSAMCARFYGFNFRYTWSTLLIVAGMAICAVAAGRGLSQRVFGRCVLVAVTCDMLTFSFGYMPFVRSTDVFPSNPVFEFLRRTASNTQRVAAVDVVYGNNFEILYGLCSPGGYDFPTRRAAAFLSAFSHDPSVISFASDRVVQAPKGALDLTGTRYFVTTRWNKSAGRFAEFPDRFRRVLTVGMEEIFENPDAMPIVYFVPRAAVTVIPDESAELRHVLSSSFDPHRTATVSSFLPAYDDVPPNSTTTHVHSLVLGTNSVEISVSAPQAGLLLLNEVYYPGWRAEIDGQPTPVIRANYVVNAVALQSGTHIVRFEFRPLAFQLGVAVTSIAVVVCVVLLTVGRRTKG